MSRSSKSTASASSFFGGRSFHNHGPDHPFGPRPARRSEFSQLVGVAAATAALDACDALVLRARSRMLTEYPEASQ